MKENKYDQEAFFEKYRQFPRSVLGLEAAGEWHNFQKMMPNFKDKRVLDIGCGFGWHCNYAASQGAKEVTGIDLSAKMLQRAREITPYLNVTYIQMPMEELDFLEASFDVVISSLAFHYTPDFTLLCQKVYHCLSPGGAFVFSVEHPIFTAYGNQDWIYDDQGNPLYWPVDHYYHEGRREAIFLGEKVVKYHKTLTTYLSALLYAGFRLENLVEPKPTQKMLDNMDGMEDELRRPMMLLFSLQKPA